MDRSPPRGAVPGQRRPLIHREAPLIGCRGGAGAALGALATVIPMRLVAAGHRAGQPRSSVRATDFSAFWEGAPSIDGPPAYARGFPPRINPSEGPDWPRAV